MLVLSRMVDEAILIGDDVRIVLCEINRGRVKIGIEAPKTTLILREELKGRQPNGKRRADTEGTGGSSGGNGDGRRPDSSKERVNT